MDYGSIFWNSKDSSTKFSSLPIFDKPISDDDDIFKKHIYDDDDGIFDGLSGMKNSSFVKYNEKKKKN